MGPRWGVASEQGADAFDFFGGDFTVPPPRPQTPEEETFIRKRAQKQHLSHAESGMRRSMSLPELKPRSGRKLPPLPGIPPPLPDGLLASWSDSPEHLGFNLLGMSSKMDPRDRPTSRSGGPRPPRHPPPMKAIRRLLSDEDQTNPLGFDDSGNDATEAAEVLQQPAPKIQTLQLRSKRRPSKKPALAPILETAALNILSARSPKAWGAPPIERCTGQVWDTTSL